MVIVSNVLESSVNRSYFIPLDGEN